MTITNYDPRFDHKNAATLPLTGAEIVLLSQNGAPVNATLAQVTGSSPALVAETAARIAADALLAPIASPIFTGPLSTGGVLIDRSATAVTPLTGGSVVIPAGVARIVISPAASVATLTITTPAAPALSAGNIQPLSVVFTAAVTGTLTWASGAGSAYGGVAMPSTVAAGSRVSLEWIQNLGQWFHSVSV